MASVLEANENIVQKILYIYIFTTTTLWVRYENIYNIISCSRIINCYSFQISSPLDGNNITLLSVFVTEINNPKLTYILFCRFLFFTSSCLSKSSHFKVLHKFSKSSRLTCPVTPFPHNARCSLGSDMQQIISPIIYININQYYPGGSAAHLAGQATVVACEGEERGLDWAWGALLVIHSSTRTF